MPSLLTQVTDYTSEQSIDKLDIMLVEIGPNDVRPHAIPAQVLALCPALQLPPAHFNCGRRWQLVGEACLYVCTGLRKKTRMVLVLMI